MHKKFYLKEDGETTEEAIACHLSFYFKNVKEAIEKASNNISKSSKFFVIDQNEIIYFEGINE